MSEGKLHMGWEMVDITPPEPVSLYGQYYERMSQYVQHPLMATVCAFESVDSNGQTDYAIMVSVDLTHVEKALQNALRTRVKECLPDVDVRKLFVNAVHTHSAPDPDSEGYRVLLTERVANAVEKAWKNRRLVGVSRALEYVVVGHNRRVQYADGTTEMYGSTGRPDFVAMEGGCNHGVDMLFCWDANKKLIGIIMNVSCPAQVTEAKYFVSSDYWGEVRKGVADRFGPNVYVLPQCGAAGDVSPRDLPRGYKADGPDMWDASGAEEIGRRLIRAVEDAHRYAKQTIRTNVVFRHDVKAVFLPVHRYSEQEIRRAEAVVCNIRSREPNDLHSSETAWNRFLQEIKENEAVQAFGPWDNKNSDFGVLKINESLLKCSEKQHEHPFYEMELHVLRVGDVVFVTNPFELFSDYGFRIMGRSCAKQTFLVQLCGDWGDYLPTQRAMAGGGYSAMACRVGPEGGTVLVNETVEQIKEVFR